MREGVTRKPTGFLTNLREHKGGCKVRGLSVSKYDLPAHSAITSPSYKSSSPSSAQRALLSFSSTMFAVGRKLLLCAFITILRVCVKVTALNGFRKVALGNGMIGGNPYSLKTDVHHKSRLHADNLANKKLCSSYTMLVARGTRYSPKTVRPFETMITWIRADLPGGEVYHVRYPADDHQKWGRGSDDVSVIACSAFSLVTR